MRVKPWHWLSLCVLLLTLVGCVHRAPAPCCTPPDFKRPKQDGKPSWQMDVSKIPDAVPQPHQGAYKNAPYQVLGKTYYPLSVAAAINYREQGLASWYGTAFHRQPTANGEIYDVYGMTAAHKTLPLPSYVRVTHLGNGKSVILRVNDRGPFYDERIIDLSYAAAMKLGYADNGIARVQVEVIDPKQWQAKNALTPTPDNRQAATKPADFPGTPKNPRGVSELYLQVAAFANRQTAEQVQKQLSQIPVASFISPLAIDGQILHRVRVGPITQLDDAKLLQQEIERLGLGPARIVTADR